MIHLEAANGAWLWNILFFILSSLYMRVREKPEATDPKWLSTG